MLPTMQKIPIYGLPYTLRIMYYIIKTKTINLNSTLLKDVEYLTVKNSPIN